MQINRCQVGNQQVDYIRYLHLACDGCQRQTSKMHWMTTKLVDKNDLAGRLLSQAPLPLLLHLSQRNRLVFFIWELHPKSLEKAMKELFSLHPGYWYVCSWAMEGLLIPLSSKPKKGLISLIGADGLLSARAKAIMPGVVNKPRTALLPRKMVETWFKKKIWSGLLFLRMWRNAL